MIGLFGYWRQHIPYLQIILKRIYEVIKKSQDFIWGSKQKEAKELIIKMIKEYKELVYIQPTDTVIVEVLYSQGYGNWNIFAKSDRILPIGFYCKRFPWSENKYSLFERTVWAVYEACRSVHSLLRNNETIVRTEMPIEDWIKAPGEAWAGLPIEAKVLHWKWYLMDFYKQNKVSSKGSITNKSNDILHTVNLDDWLERPSVIPAVPS